MDLYYLSLAGRLTERMCAMPDELTDVMVIERARARADELEHAERVHRLRQVLGRAMSALLGLRSTNRDRPAH